mmetsp:Transcript_3322/g.6332  ORF Transcript_3322/g.6332 Transcript_3322/m.6332 type:complete len:360 (-) Transcript_3322:47-1126(-)
MSDDDNKMVYKVMGNTGIVASAFAFGFWATFGAKDDLREDEGIEAAKNIMRVARDGGINLFDNAEAYGTPFGEAERIFGKALESLQEEDPEKWRRSDLVITTKIYWGGEGYNEKGLSRKHIKEGLKKSLDRLQLDYVDLVFCHRPDKYTPTATVVRAMSELVQQGKAMAWGTSEWSAQQITEAFYIAREGGFEPPQMEQPQYHMFHRERFETEYAPMYKEPYNIGTTIWSPLASGLLTGKYQDGIPEGSRLASEGYSWLGKTLDKWKEDGTIDKVDKLIEYAKKLDCSVSQLALAWCAKNPNVTTVLLGATKVHQIEENLGALKVLRKLTDEHMEEIEEILGNKPAEFMGTFRQFDTLE